MSYKLKIQSRGNFSGPIIFFLLAKVKRTEDSYGSLWPLLGNDVSRMNNIVSQRWHIAQVISFFKKASSAYCALAEGSPGSWCGELGHGAVVYKKNASEAEVRTKMRSNGLVWQVVLRELAGAGNRSRHATRVRANPVLLRLVSRSKFRPEVAKRVTKSDKKCTPKHSWRVVEHNIKECANWLPHNDNSLYLKAIRSTPRRLIN
jgi:hypothetical protein